MPAPRALAAAGAIVTAAQGARVGLFDPAIMRLNLAAPPAKAAAHAAFYGGGRVDLERAAHGTRGSSFEFGRRAFGG